MKRAVRCCRRCGVAGGERDFYFVFLKEDIQRFVPSKVRVEFTPIQIADTDCYSGDGSSYEGKVKKTIAGVECLPWTTAGSEYSKLGNHRYCRNPGPPGYNGGPWCYTSHQHIVWGYCGIRRCEGDKFGELGEKFSNLFLAAMSSSRSDVVTQCVRLFVHLSVTKEFFKPQEARKFQGCFEEVSRMFQGSFKEVSRMF